jgi:PTH1 family peptidyl-tRNA hydrolase
MTLRRLFQSFRAPRAESAQGLERGREPWLLVGLGNPGERYARSRHNLGFLAIELIAREAAISLGQQRFKARLGKGDLDGNPVLLAQPQTFMNLSGESVVSLLGYFKLPPGRLLVIHDELDLEPGVVRLKRGGGDGGHRGLRSIIELLGNANFLRLRIGVGHAPQGREPVSYLLEPLSASQMAEFQPQLQRAVQAARAVINDGVERAMNQFNQRG